MKPKAIKTFITNLALERSITPKLEKLGKIKSTMQLYCYENDSYGIEWDIPSLEETIYIGIWVEKDTKTVIDYDGVFSLSQEAIEMLEENGFNCDQVRKDLK
jgi:hypothetical protein